MTTTSPRSLISGALRNAVATSVDTEAPISRGFSQEWQRLIDHRLVEWQCNPGLLDEEGTVTPSRSTILLAINLANRMNITGMAAPSRIVPDTEGGIVFERKGPNVFESIRISAEGTVEHRVFENCRLTNREPWLLDNP